MTTPVNKGFVSLLLLIAAMTAACGGEESAPRPNVVIYLVDTLRQDHLGVYGYERDTSPGVDALAEDSIAFEQAFATSSWTKASTGSLLTGLQPRQHGAVSRNSPLSAQAELLSEILRSMGYYCAAIITNPFVAEHWGFNRGYDLFEDLGEQVASAGGWMQIHAQEVNERAFEVLDDRPPEKPFFLYLHTIDPHGPNDPLEPYDTLFTDTPRPPGIASKLDKPAQPMQLHNTVALYDSEIRYADDQFSAFLQGLKDRDLYDNTVIWFLSDHGEEFLDHGRGGHGTQLFNELVKVPLILKLPDQKHAGQVVNTPVSLVDVLVTQLELHQREPASNLPGRNLLDLLEPDSGDVPIFLDLNLTKQELYVSEGIVLGDYKYFEELLPEPQEYLFNIHEDPEETRNLVEVRPEKLAELKLLLDMQRASEQSGLVVKGIGSKASAGSSWRMTLSTEGAFVDVSSTDLESGDSVDYEVGGSTLTIRCDLSPRRDSAAGKGRIPDEDTLTIRVDPPDARVFVQQYKADQAARMPVYLGPERKKTRPPLDFVGNDDSLRVEQLSTLFTQAERNSMGSDGDVNIPPGVYVVRLPDGPSSEIGIPEDMVERLKALGYL
jgi:arylsulfatase A-like enzyme